MVSEALFNALDRFKPDGMGLIIGSLTPWVEALCLHFGAHHVTTVEYHPIVSTHPRIGTLHPYIMAQNYSRHLQSFDFIVTFSSIEHSGLGRYGDNIDPFGDIREIEKAHCFLKNGGLLYIGLPVTRDTLVWNAHRMYGNIRLSLLFAGFDILGTYYRSQSFLNRLTYINWSKYEQHVFVLRKISYSDCLGL